MMQLSSVPPIPDSVDGTATQFQPLQDYVLIERIDLENATKGGILLAQDRMKFEQRGRVLAIGPGGLLADGSRSATHLKVGDVIVCDPQRVVWLNDVEPVGLVQERWIYSKVL